VTAAKPKEPGEDQFAFYMDLVGHDILNNNQAVLGYLELILANPGSDKTVKRYAEKAYSHVRTSTMLVENGKRLMAVRGRVEEPLKPMDIGGTLERSQRDVSRFFPDKKVKVHLGELPKEAKALGNSAAEDLIMSAMVSAVRLDPREEVELNVKLVPAMFRGAECWALTIEDAGAELPPSIKDKDIKCVYLLDSSVAVKLSGLLFTKMVAEMLGGDFDAYELSGRKDRPGAGFTLTLRRADRK